MYNQWRRFQFFDKELVTADGSSSGAPHPELQKLKVTAVSSGKGQIVFGDSDGCVTLCDRKFTLNKFQAYEKCVSKLYQLVQQNVLVSCGDDLASSAGEGWSEISNAKPREGLLSLARLLGSAQGVGHG